MNKIFTLLLLCSCTFYIQAQTLPPTPATQAFGKISKEGLELKNCDFEKDANAEILFDKGSVSLDAGFDVLLYERHIRIKIFNEKAKDQANVRIKFFSGGNAEFISNIKAETINLNNGNIEFTPVNKDLIYRKVVDKNWSEIVFALPNVQPGSVIEYKYTISSSYLDDFPDWYFQGAIPTRYSEFNTDLPNEVHYKKLLMVKRPFVINTEKTKAMANIPSLRIEPYMSSLKDNAERMYHELSGVEGNYSNFSTTWKELAEKERKFDDFGGQFKKKLTGEDLILTKAKGLKTEDEKIALIFNEVKNAMKWNGSNDRYTNDGTTTAWDKKIGNSTEINLILFHLIKKAGVPVFPMLVSTQDNGKVNPGYPSRYQFNKTVAYVPGDSTNYYVLDATNKYASYKTIPVGLLNSYGFYINDEGDGFDLIAIKNSTPVKETAIVAAEIGADGKMSGTAQIISDSYSRINKVELYKTDGEKKYIDYLTDGDNGLKVSSVKFDAMEDSTLPLIQNIKFDVELAGSDGAYIYVNPNMFTGLRSNPFLSETRTTDVSFGYLQTEQIMGSYKIPAGYKIDALPKNITLTMPDNSIVFKRIAGEQDGTVMVRYVINRKAALFFREDYSSIYEFYKKMLELLNEQIVFKKS